MLAIIPARGGSKGLPGKNIKLLNGKPLIAYTIEAAINSAKITRIILSTDDEEIAKIGTKYGAENPFMRPQYLATDKSKSIDVYQYTLDKLSEQGQVYNEFIVLQPTSPLRTSKDIDCSIQLFEDKKADSVISFCKELHPIQWHKYINNEGQFEEIFEQSSIQNRQEERDTYFPNGAIYIFKRSIIDLGKYYTKDTFAYIMERQNSVDIDTIEDFEYAEFLLSKSKH